MQTLKSEEPALTGIGSLLLLHWLLLRFFGSRFPGRLILARHALRDERFAGSPRELLIGGAKLAGLHFLLRGDRECRRTEKHGREQAGHEDALQHGLAPCT